MYYKIKTKNKEIIPLIIIIATIIVILNIFIITLNCTQYNWSF